MVTYSQQYEDKLWEIQNMNILRRAVLVPHKEKILNIDLEKRTVEVPTYLSVSQDHQAETIYFKFDRFYDMIDLTTMVCVIQYKNAKGEEYVYPVPFYDTQKFLNEGKVLIPWCIQGAATKYAGTIEFSIRFFRLDPSDKHIIYDLNTLPAKGKILQGQDWDLNEIAEKQVTFDDAFLFNVQRVLDAQDGLNLYWVEV